MSKVHAPGFRHVVQVRGGASLYYDHWRGCWVSVTKHCRVLHMFQQERDDGHKLLEKWKAGWRPRMYTNKVSLLFEDPE